MSSFKKSSFAMALMVAVGSAQAASVEVYGTVDTGLLYTHESSDWKDNNKKNPRKCGQLGCGQWNEYGQCDRDPWYGKYLR